MKVRVLGCSGGINQNVATTSFLVDDDILLDAGTGVCDLSLEEMRKIRHIFITHSHLDHIASIPLLADTLFDDLIGNPITVHALPETIKALKDHIFNWVIWPDFTALPHENDAILKFEAMHPTSICQLGARQVEMIGVNHSVPAVGYRFECNGKSFAFSGDTSSNENFWVMLNRHDSLGLLFVESAFSDKDLQLAKKAFHYCPQLLAQDLKKLQHKPVIYLSHLKPGSEQEIVLQCTAVLPEQNVKQLKNGDIFHL